MYLLLHILNILVEVLVLPFSASSNSKVKKHLAYNSDESKIYKCANFFSHTRIQSNSLHLVLICHLWRSQVGQGVHPNLLRRKITIFIYNKRLFFMYIIDVELSLASSYFELLSESLDSAIVSEF